MKILFLTHYFSPEGNAPASRIYETAKRWVNQDHEVHVITCVPNVPNGEIYKGYRNRFYQTEIIEGIKVSRVWTYIAPNKGIVRRILNYGSYMWMAVGVGLFVKRPDVLIATSPQFFCGWAGVVLSKLRRLSFILEIRDLWPDSIVAVGALKNRFILSVLKHMEMRMYRTAHHIVAVGEGYKQCLIKKGVPTEKVSVVTNGVDRDLFFPRQPDLALKQKLGLNGEFICSYIGTVGMACGLEVVIEAAARLKQLNRNDVKLLIVGDGATRSELEAKARAQGLDNVLFVGRQPKESIPAFLSITDACLVHLKKTDLFTTVLPSKIFEAAGMGKPIINGVEGYAQQVVESAQAGMSIPPEDSEQLVKALITLAKDPIVRHAYGNAGYKFIIENYDREYLAKQYVEILKRAVKQRIVVKPIDSMSKKQQKTISWV